MGGAGRRLVITAALQKDMCPRGRNNLCVAAVMVRNKVIPHFMFEKGVRSIG